MILINLADRRLTHEYYVGVIQACTQLLELRSNETGEQCGRLERLAEIMGHQMKLSSREIRDLVCGAALHDIGKIGIPDKILHKPGKLTDAEREIIKKHVPLGVIRLRRLRMPESIVMVAAQHHEDYDGSGYPNGLKGENICLAARIFKVCDAYDAMVSDRCYRKGLSHEKAIQELKDFSGTQFDPKVVEVFLDIDPTDLQGYEKIAWQ